MIIFKDREEAGKKLAEKLVKFKSENPFVFAIPNGGVPVGFEISKKLSSPFDVLVVRKIQIPWNTEAGYGAVAPDGEIILNKEMILGLGLSKEVIEEGEKETLKKIKERERIYRDKKPFPNLQDKTVILTDDGLASGYTMKVGISFLRKKKAKKIVVAVPISSGTAEEEIKPLVYEFISLQVQKHYPFAVASFYKNWYDLPDEEVVEYLRRARRLAGE